MVEDAVSDESEIALENWLKERGWNWNFRKGSWYKNEIALDRSADEIADAAVTRFSKLAGVWNEIQNMDTKTLAVVCEAFNAGLAEGVYCAAVTYGNGRRSNEKEKHEALDRALVKARLAGLIGNNYKPFELWEYYDGPGNTDSLKPMKTRSFENIVCAWRKNRSRKHFQ
jgi:hypothetical protein